VRAPHHGNSHAACLQETEWAAFKRPFFYHFGFCSGLPDAEHQFVALDLQRLRARGFRRNLILHNNAQGLLSDVPAVRLQDLVQRRALLIEDDDVIRYLEAGPRGASSEAA
jgi:hypothetical protein